MGQVLMNLTTLLGGVFAILIGAFFIALSIGILVVPYLLMTGRSSELNGSPHALAGTSEIKNL